MKKFTDFISENAEKPNVYKRTSTEYYSSQRKTVNPYTGSARSAKKRTVTDWVAVVDGKKIGGHGSKKSAIATWHEMSKKKD